MLTGDLKGDNLASTAFNMTTPTIRQTVLEVERKFSHLRIYPFKADGGSPPFHTLAYHGTETFCDKYFDHHNRLSAAGTWVRRRNGHWESKIRQAGDYTNSQFQEIQDLAEISRHVYSITKISGQSCNDFGLSKMAEFVTYREKWIADERFEVVLDNTDFGHTVGEIELKELKNVRPGIEAQACCKLLDQEIEAFMRRYSWAFSSAPPIGKLTAYFSRLRRQDCELLFRYY